MYKIFFYILDAVGARFKIDPDRFDDFFRTCLRRTLAQLLCDIRREQKRAGNSQVNGGGARSRMGYGDDDGNRGNVAARNGVGVDVQSE